MLMTNAILGQQGSLDVHPESYQLQAMTKLVRGELGKGQRAGCISLFWTELDSTEGFLLVPTTKPEGDCLRLQTSPLSGWSQPR